jgi:hypothetical protein
LSLDASPQQSRLARGLGRAKRVIRVAQRVDSSADLARAHCTEAEAKMQVRKQQWIRSDLSDRAFCVASCPVTIQVRREVDQVDISPCAEGTRRQYPFERHQLVTRHLV